MSVATCRSSTAVSLPLEKKEVTMMPTPFAASKTWLPSAPAGNDTPTRAVAMTKNEEQEVVGGAKLDIWTSIHATKAKEAKDEPYVHPLTRRSSTHMSQRSLQICTESLGSETGSDDFFSSSDDDDVDVESPWFSTCPNKQVVQQQVDSEDDDDDDDEEEETDDFVGVRRKEQACTVNYHCSLSRRSPCRSFPPPLPSISRRDGPCFQMRPHRRNGRLVVEAVAVPSQNYLHAERQDGRLLLSFINTTTTRQSNTNHTVPDTLADLAPQQTQAEEEEEEEEEEEVEDEEEVMELEDQEEEEEEGEEEVEVVDRGTVVEVKVSTQPQQQSGGSAAVKVHRSSIVINKFVSCTSSQLNDKESDQNAINSSSADDYAVSTAGPLTPGRRSTNTTTTAAAAAVAASSLSTLPADGNQPSFDTKLLFTSKRRNREELLRDMRRCSQLRKPLFIWEPTCIATSS